MKNFRFPISDCRLEERKTQATRGFPIVNRQSLICVGAALWLISLSLHRGAQANTPAPPLDTAKKLIALTFDDGPRPWVLKGNSQPGFASPSLLDLLDREGVKATFFVMAWRLAPAADKECRRIDAGITCRQAAQEEHRRGHEIENHTYGHGDFRRMNKRYGEEWILNDIDRASRTIEPITGVRQRYLRPPDWDIWPELAQRIEERGYHVMTKSTSVPPTWRDVDSEDYFCYGKDRSKCPQPSLYDYVLRTIEQRERKAIDGQILVFHELPSSVEVLSNLIPELKKRGYTFVTLQKYMQAEKGN